MTHSVSQTFNSFLRDAVNLDPADTDGARKSRIWLQGVMDGFHAKHDDFPRPYPAVHMGFGSFARRTKIRELDDVDLIHGLHAEGTTYLDTNGTVTLTVPESSRLWAFRHDGTKLLNSRRVINHFVKQLAGVPQYASAATNRRGEAAVLNLSSYPWSFDIVPAFLTTQDWLGRTYYIIPNGEGDWKKTDPRIDQARVSATNQLHHGRVLNIIRLLKFWNRRSTMPSVGSYLLENMILSYYEGRSTTASANISEEVAPVLEHLADAVYGSVPDPKQIQGDLNDLSWDAIQKIRDRALADARKARTARELEADENEDTSKALAQWAEIFGPSFTSATGT